MEPTLGFEQRTCFIREGRHEQGVNGVLWPEVRQIALPQLDSAAGVALDLQSAEHAHVTPSQ
jgi:hypothetical protein